MIKDFPEQLFVIAHGAGSVKTLRLFAERLGSRENVYYEISTAISKWERSGFPKEVSKLFFEETTLWKKVGMRNIIFGSDLGFFREIWHILNFFTNTGHFSKSDKKSYPMGERSPIVKKIKS